MYLKIETTGDVGKIKTKLKKESSYPVNEKIDKALK